MKIFNTMTRQKEEFVPLHPGKVGIYACGPTVYNFFHIGNARPFIVFDVLRRYFRHKGYEVKFVQNFTDIDDKLIRRAIEEGTTVPEIAEKYIKEYYTDAEGLGVEKADVHPRATQHIGEIIAMIKKLENNGYAYKAENGDVYFDTAADKEYGKLSGQNLDDREAGARIDVDESKKSYMDFALWKAQKPGEPAWKSPWGMGRPGWHIECAAMSTKYLGETFDIHCGGVDLVFPHHENEIAESECATGKPFARYWMHNGHINVDNRKMSKSLGNFLLVRDISKEFDLEVVRMFMLSAHYRSPINYSHDLLVQAQSGLERLYTARNNAAFAKEHAVERELNAEETAFVERSAKAIEAFDAAMDDDLNTADAISVIFDYARDMNTVLADSKNAALKAYDVALDTLANMTGVLGLLRKEADTVPAEVKELLAQRVDAKKAKNFALADEIRDKITAMGYIIEDTPKGAKVKKA